MIRLELSWPVSFSSYFNDRLQRSKRGRIQRDQWASEIAAQLGGKPKELFGPIKLEAWLHAPTGKRFTNRPWDQDNYMGKAQVDILNQSGLFFDDSQIVLFIVRKSFHMEHGRVVVEITALDEEGEREEYA